jgi:hypothetical protein
MHTSIAFSLARRRKDLQSRVISLYFCRGQLAGGFEIYKKEGPKYLQRLLSRQKKERPWSKLIPTYLCQNPGQLLDENHASAATFKNVAGKLDPTAKVIGEAKITSICEGSQYST